MEDERSDYERQFGHFVQTIANSNTGFMIKHRENSRPTQYYFVAALKISHVAKGYDRLFESFVFKIIFNNNLGDYRLQKLYDCNNNGNRDTRDTVWFLTFLNAQSHTEFIRLADNLSFPKNNPIVAIKIAVKPNGFSNSAILDDFRSRNYSRDMGYGIFEFNKNYPERIQNQHRNISLQSIRSRMSQVTNPTDTNDSHMQASDVNNNDVIAGPQNQKNPVGETISNSENLSQTSPIHFRFNESEISTSADDTNDSFVTVYENDLDLSKEYGSNDDDANASSTSRSELWYTPSAINLESDDNAPISINNTQITNDNTPISISTPKQTTCILLGVPCANDSASNELTQTLVNGTPKQYPTIFNQFSNWLGSKLIQK
jgi:hypothetical protein